MSEEPFKYVRIMEVIRCIIRAVPYPVVTVGINALDRLYSRITCINTIDGIIGRARKHYAIVGSVRSPYGQVGSSDGPTHVRPLGGTADSEDGGKFFCIGQRTCCILPGTTTTKTKPCKVDAVGVNAQVGLGILE